MKKLLIVLVSVLMACVSVSYAEYVNGYTRKDGTYVNGYNRSDANDTVRDNYSHKGNVNPYTGAAGTNYDRHNKTSEYYDGTEEKSSGNSYGTYTQPKTNNNWNSWNTKSNAAEETEKPKEKNWWEQ